MFAFYFSRYNSECAWGRFENGPVTHKSFLNKHTATGTQNRMGRLRTQQRALCGQSSTGKILPLPHPLLFGTQLRRSHFSLPVLALIFPACSLVSSLIKICIHLPTPDPSPPSLWTASLTSGSVTSAGNGCRTGCLLAGAGLLPLVQSHVSMVYYVLLLLRCFSGSHTVLPMKHSLGVIFFLLTFLMLCCIFLQFPVFLSCLPPCHICMLCMYGSSTFHV